MEDLQTAYGTETLLEYPAAVGLDYGVVYDHRRRCQLLGRITTA